MSNYFLHDQYIDIGTVGNGATTAYRSPVPIDVKRVIVIVNTAQTTANAVMTIGVRDNDDTPSETKGNFTIPFAGSVAGQIFQVPLIGAGAETTGIDGSIVNLAGDGFIEVSPGQEFFISEAGGAAGVFQVYLEYEKQGFAGRRADGTTTNPVVDLVYTAV